MREFDDFEKQILVILKQEKEEKRTSSFSSLLQSRLDDKAVYLINEERKAYLCVDTKVYCEYNPETNIWDMKRHHNFNTIFLIDNIVRIIFLLNYLENHGFAFLFKYGITPDNYMYTKDLGTNPSPTRTLISDEKITELLFQYFGKQIILSESIVTLVNDGFMFREQIHHNQTFEIAKKSIKLAYISIIASLIIGIISLLISSSIFN